MTTGRLQEAREFLADLVDRWREEGRHATLDEQQAKALPHLEAILDAMTPVVVEDAHLERAREVEAEILSSSPAESGQPHPPEHAIRVIAQAIANAEGRGQLKSLDLIEDGWGVIANSFGGNWDQASAEWRAAAERYRDAYHALLNKKTEETT